MKILIFSFFLGLSILTGGVPEQPVPKLAVFIVIDHLNADHFNRYGTFFTGGLKWFSDHGVIFSQTYHNHAESATAPGHYTLASGQYPGPAGIVGNSWYDRKLKKKTYCVEDPNSFDLISGKSSVSFNRVKTRSLGDWLKEKSPRSKVFSIAGKDRSSILMGGKNPDLAVWYNWNGQFTTSTYYANKMPPWLTTFNERSNIESYKDSVWTRSKAPEFYEKNARRDNFPGELDIYSTNTYSPTFPIAYDEGTSAKDVAGSIGDRPWLDRITLDLAKVIIREEDLGLDENPDVLFISLSGMDIMTHDFGPFSQEVLDALLKIDQYLGLFIEELDKTVGLENIIFTISADHGGMALPEYLVEYENKISGRISSKDMKKAFRKSESDLYAKTGVKKILSRVGKSIYVDEELKDKYSLNVGTISDIIDNRFLKIEGIETIIKASDIVSPDSKIPFKELYINSYHPYNSSDYYVLPKEFWIYKHPYGTTHGTPRNYDRHVISIFAGEQIIPREEQQKINTVDLAPTLGNILGLDTPDRIDGKIIRDIYIK